MSQQTARATLVERLAANLATCMAASKLSQAQLAAKSGVGQTTISLYLNPSRRLPGKSGKTPSPKLGEIELLARALGTDPLVLFSEPSEAKGLMQAPPAWPFEEVQFERWDRLKERQKGVVEKAMNDALDQIEAAGGDQGNRMAA